MADGLIADYLFTVGIDSKSLNTLQAKLKQIGAQVGKATVPVSPKQAKEVEKLTKANEKLAKSNENLKRKLDGTGKAAQGAGKDLKKLHGYASGTVGSFSQMAEALKKVTFWLTATGLVFTAIRGIGGLVTSINEIEFAVIGLQKVTRGTIEDVDEFRRSNIRLATELSRAYGAVVPEVIDAMATVARLGFEQHNIAKVTTAALLAQNIAEMQVGDATRLLVSAMKQYNGTAADTLHYLDVYNELSNVAYVRAQDLAEGVARSGIAARVAGVEFEQLSAMLATVIEATGRGGREIGTAYRTVFTYLYRPETQAKLKDVGFDVDAATSAVDILGQVAQSYDDLTEAQKKSIAQTMAGVRRINELLALLQNWDRFLELNTQALMAQGSAVKENAIFMDSMKVQLRILGAEAQTLGTVIGRSLLPVLKGLIVHGQSVVAGFRSWPGAIAAVAVSFGIVTSAIKAYHHATKLALTGALTKDLTGMSRFLRMYNANLEMAMAKTHGWAQANMVVAGTFKKLGVVITTALRMYWPVLIALGVLGAAWGVGRVSKAGERRVEAATERVENERKVMELHKGQAEGLQLLLERYVWLNAASNKTRENEEKRLKVLSSMANLLKTTEKGEKWLEGGQLGIEGFETEVVSLIGDLDRLSIKSQKTFEESLVQGIQIARDELEKLTPEIERMTSQIEEFRLGGGQYRTPWKRPKWQEDLTLWIYKTVPLIGKIPGVGLDIYGFDKKTEQASKFRNELGSLLDQLKALGMEELPDPFKKATQSLEDYKRELQLLRDEIMLRLLPAQKALADATAQVSIAARAMPTLMARFRAGLIGGTGITAGRETQMSALVEQREAYARVLREALKAREEIEAKRPPSDEKLTIDQDQLVQLKAIKELLALEFIKNEPDRKRIMAEIMRRAKGETVPGETDKERALGIANEILSSSGIAAVERWGTIHMRTISPEWLKSVAGKGPLPPATPSTEGERKDVKELQRDALALSQGRIDAAKVYESALKVLDNTIRKSTVSITQLDNQMEQLGLTGVDVYENMKALFGVGGASIQQLMRVALQRLGGMVDWNKMEKAFPGLPASVAESMARQGMLPYFAPTKGGAAELQFEGLGAASTKQLAGGLRGLRDLNILPFVDPAIRDQVSGLLGVVDIFDSLAASIRGFAIEAKTGITGLGQIEQETLKFEQSMREFEITLRKFPPELLAFMGINLGTLIPGVRAARRKQLDRKLEGIRGGIFGEEWGRQQVPITRQREMERIRRETTLGRPLTGYETATMQGAQAQADLTAAYALSSALGMMGIKAKDIDKILDGFWKTILLSQRNLAISRKRAEIRREDLEFSKQEFAYQMGMVTPTEKLANLNARIVQLKQREKDVELSPEDKIKAQANTVQAIQQEVQYREELVRQQRELLSLQKQMTEAREIELSKFQYQQLLGRRAGFPVGSPRWVEATKGLAQIIVRHKQAWESAYDSISSNISSSIIGAFGATTTKEAFRRFVASMSGIFRSIGEEWIKQTLMKSTMFREGITPLVDMSQEIKGEYSNIQIKRMDAEVNLTKAIKDNTKALLGETAGGISTKSIGGPQTVAEAARGELPGTTSLYQAYKRGGEISNTQKALAKAAKAQSDATVDIVKDLTKQQQRVAKGISGITATAGLIGAYQTGDPLGGATSGYMLSTLMGFNPWIGAGLGFLGGMFGKGKKEKTKKAKPPAGKLGWAPEDMLFGVPMLMQGLPAAAWGSYRAPSGAAAMMAGLNAPGGVYEDNSLTINMQVTGVDRDTADGLVKKIAIAIDPLLAKHYGRDRRRRTNVLVGGS